MNLSFKNTEIAFAHKSNKDLKKARQLFQAFSSAFLVNHGPKLANFALSLRLPIKGIIKSTLFHQFCGGETIEESYLSAKQLSDNGIGAILDYSVEGEGSVESFESCYNELIKVITYAKNRQEFPFAVFKCSGIGSFAMLKRCSSDASGKESNEFKAFERRFTALCDLAYTNDVPLLVDAEESWIQDAIDEITYQMMARYNKEKAIVFNTIQCYRTNRVEAVSKAIEDAKANGYKLGFKLVRGAYMEKERLRAERKKYPSPIQPTKADTDKEYDNVLEMCFNERSIVSTMAGTHNESSSYMLAQLIDKEGIAPSDNRFWFAQLYGMSDHISFNLAKAGYNVAKYLPYGPVKEVLPYLSRRAKENSSVKGQAGRELNLIDTEIKRRKGLQ